MVTIAKSVQGAVLLLVEDERCHDWTLADLLQSGGYIVRPTGGGEDLMDEYDAHRPDAVLVGRSIQGAERREVCRRLHSRHGETCAPIFWVTNDDRCWELDEPTPGVVEILRGPLEFPDAGIRINAHVETRRRSLQHRAVIRQLQETVAAKDKLIGMCAHELRTPLSSVCGLAEFLGDPATGALNSAQAEIANAIREAGHNMLKLVNQLLDLSAFGAGKAPLERAPAALRGVVERAVFMISVVAARKNIRVVMQPPVGDEPPVEMDAMRIREVVDNLLSNAVKYSPPGSCVGVALELLPGGGDAEASVRLSVRDQGPGVPAAERDRLFREFSRLSALPTAGEKSTGLGLAICRKIIDLHGGSLGVVNHPEGGCVFSFILPLSPCN